MGKEAKREGIDAGMGFLPDDSGGWVCPMVSVTPFDGRPTPTNVGVGRGMDYR
jgi:hypothetical protein